MALNVSILRVKRASAHHYNGSDFSTVTVRDSTEEHSDNYVTIFIEGPGHEDAAARIAALINEQVVRRDAPKVDPEVASFYERMLPPSEFPASEDDGPTYDGPDEEEAARLEQNERYEFEQAAQAQAEERTYNEEDRLGKEAHLRSVRRDDKPWTPHEDEIEEDVAEGRRDAEGEPLTITARIIGGPNAGVTFTATADPKDEP